MKKDTLIRATTANDQFRIFAVDSTLTVQRARDIHDLAPLATLLLGRMISAAAMMSMELKNENSSLTMHLACSGALHGAMVVCEHGGLVRGYANEPKLFYEDIPKNLELATAVGNGTISIIKDIGAQRNTTGVCEIVSGEIAEDIAHYYMQSEQIPSAIALGVLFDKDSTVRAAGGYLIQQLPFADPAFADMIVENINKTPNLTDLMDMGYSITDVLDKFVLKNIEWSIIAEQDLHYRCNCSKEKFERALITLGKEELGEMIAEQKDIETLCSFCDQKYSFSTAQLQTLASLLDR